MLKNMLIKMLLANTISVSKFFFWKVRLLMGPFFFAVESSLNPLSCLPVLFFYFLLLFVVRERLCASKYVVQFCGHWVNHLMSLCSYSSRSCKAGPCLDKYMSGLQHHLPSLPMGLIQLCRFILQQGQSCLVLLGGKAFLTFWKDHAKGGGGGKLHYPDQTVAQETSCSFVQMSPSHLCMSILKPRLPRWLSGKEPTCQCRGRKRCRFDPWVRKIPWRRAWQTTPVLLPWESGGQRSYSPWIAESWTRPNIFTHIQKPICFFLDTSMTWEERGGKIVERYLGI